MRKIYKETKGNYLHFENWPIVKSGPKESGEKQFIYISKIVNVLKDSGHE